MNPTNTPGFLLAIEGIDGAGKSTLLQALARYCAGRGLEVVVSKEPTDGPWGRKLRESAQTGRLSLDEELDLFLHDRQEHVKNLILPALNEGKVILLDRYYLSTAAYQGARGADPAKILADNECFAPPPDLALLLDIPPTSGLSRVRRRGDLPNEFERESALEAARGIFLGIERPWLVRIDASQSPDEVARLAIEKFALAYEAKKARPSVATASE